MTLNEVLFVILAALNLADVYTTMCGLASGKTEANSAMVWLIEKIGTAPALLLSKAVFLGFIYWYLELMPAWVIGALIGLYVYTVISNIKVISGK